MSIQPSRFETLSFRPIDDGLECVVGNEQVGYIRVDSANQMKFVYVHPEFRRLGIGSKLYVAMAKQLATIGSKLYAADYQHDNAIALWKYLENQFPNRTGRTSDGRLFLSYL